MRRDSTATPDDNATGMVCPECGEPAVPVRPTTLLPYAAHGRPVPCWAHTDGQPLCPVIGPAGYQPAHPVPAASTTEPNPARPGCR